MNFFLGLVIHRSFLTFNKHKNSLPMSVMIRIVFFFTLLSNSLQYNTYFSLTNGFYYQPSNIILSLSTFTGTRTMLECAMRCLNDLQCRTFNFDQDTTTCQLFEGSLDVGTLIFTSSNSVIGWLNMKPSDYLLYHTSFDRCVNHRYLFSDISTSLCQCPAHTFWNGSICLNQRFVGDLCQSDEWCRSDLNLRCISSSCVDSKFVLIVTS